MCDRAEPPVQKTLRGLRAIALVNLDLEPRKNVSGRPKYIAAIPNTREETGFAQLLDLAAVDTHTTKVVGGNRSELSDKGHRSILVGWLPGSYWFRRLQRAIGVSDASAAFLG